MEPTFLHLITPLSRSYFVSKIIKHLSIYFLNHVSNVSIWAVLYRGNLDGVCQWNKNS